jgi:hypothetical protein
MAQLSRLVLDARTRGLLEPPLLPDVPPALRTACDAKHAGPDTPDMPAESFQAMLHAWTALHGFTSLETYGHFDWMGADAVEDLFRGLVRLVARAAGIPYE